MYSRSNNQDKFFREDIYDTGNSEEMRPSTFNVSEGCEKCDSILQTKSRIRPSSNACWADNFEKRIRIIVNLFKRRIDWPLTLRFLASGDLMVSLSYQFRIGQSTAPPNTGSQYHNYKEGFSIILLALWMLTTSLCLLILGWKAIIVTVVSLDTVSLAKPLNITK
ncbi:hypothetical protein CEXT_411132 [Caerostris extrusa]|uniref:Uncharacterized protein n=1 Tax=Caerostris extrusa TaxID=172846 RepID=A0AAV4XRT6_CAEEX|nr:hypothetical protein CEXT_411132 [Caerostris extrusa]